MGGDVLGRPPIPLSGSLTWELEQDISNKLQLFGIYHGKSESHFRLRLMLTRPKLSRTASFRRLV